jgi:hypothetical protein
VDFVLDAIETEELTEQQPPVDNLAELKFNVQGPADR